MLCDECVAHLCGTCWQRDALNWKLAEPAVYQNADKTRELQSEQGNLTTRIDSLYHDWELLSEQFAEFDTPETE